MRSKNNLKTPWDVIVVGGGPAGMMAAGRAAERGLRVVLLEKNHTLGKKLLITGGGRCNVTNAEFDNRKLLSKFKKNDKFLFSPFSKWSVEETLTFFNSRGMATKLEAEGRVFPVTNKAQSVWNVLTSYMKEGGVVLKTDTEVLGFTKKDGALIGVDTKTGAIYGHNIVIATGGKSRPETGSTGEGFKWLKKIGHTIIESDPTLVPITVRDTWVPRVAGVSVSGVKITVYQNNQKQISNTGKILFTHVGLSGPTILNMSKDVRDLLKYGEVSIGLDLFPKEDEGALDRRLQKVFEEHKNKQFKNSLTGLIPSSLAPIIVELSSINPEVQCNSITRDERRHLISVLKHIPLTVQGLLGVEKAIVTSGGVALEEIDFKTMRSKIYDNLYLIGDILNIDRPSGGYSLQLCWTTGFVAGDSISLPTQH